MKLKSIKFLITAVLLLVIKKSPAQLFPKFHQKILHIPGQVLEVIHKDLNCDREIDLIVVHSHLETYELKVNRFLSIFYQNNGLFPELPSQTIAINNNEIIFDIENIDTDSLPELVFIKETGVYARKYEKTGFSQTLYTILKTSSIFLSHDPTKIRYWNFIQDIDSDKIPEIIIHKPHQLCIYSKNPEGIYTKSKSLLISQDVTLSDRNELTSIMNLPTLHISDFNGDSFLDLLLLSTNRLNIYLQNPTHRHEYPVSLIPYNFCYTMDKNISDFTTLKQLAPAPTKLIAEDLNNDGYVDILFIKSPESSFINSISQIQIYLNKYGRFDILPDQILTAENFNCEHIIMDFNKDGLLDLALLNFRIGFLAVIKFLLTQKINNSYDLYLMRTDHTYPNKSDKRIIFSRKIKINDLFASQFCQNFLGDFNGDNLTDLLIGTNDNEISIFQGCSEEIFKSKPVLKINVPITPHILVNDLDKDGISDITLWYPRNPNFSNKIILLQSNPEHLK